MGCGDGQVVSELAFYSDDLSSNPAEAYSFAVKFVFEKNENKQKEAGVGQFKKKKTRPSYLHFFLIIHFIDYRKQQHRNTFTKSTSWSLPIYYWMNELKHKSNTK